MNGPRTTTRTDASSGAIWTPAAAARLLGVAPSTLRSWHRRHQLRTTHIDPGRHRRYTAADLDALTRMKQLIADGLSTASAAESAFRPVLASCTDAHTIVDAALRLDADALVSLLEMQFTRHGLVHTWDQLCRPALNTLGGPRSTVADECVDVVHLLSWAISAALHRLPIATPPAAPAVLLACVEGERHTLPLEVLRAALAQHGTPVRLLGASLPATALIDAIARTSLAPTALILWAHASTPVLSDLVRASAKRGTRLMLAGPGWASTRHRRGVVRPATLQDALSAVNGR